MSGKQSTNFEWRPTNETLAADSLPSPVAALDRQSGESQDVGLGRYITENRAEAVLSCFRQGVLMTKCECEHYSHLNVGFLTPNGKKTHHYAALFATDAMQRVDTPTGSFFVCEACANDCLKVWHDKQNLLKEMGHE